MRPQTHYLLRHIWGIPCCLAILIFALWPSSHCAAWPAQVLSIQDGDTITVAPSGDASTPVSVRLYGIDAPESEQAGGQESTDFLRGLLPDGSDVQIIPYGTDRYGRSLGLVSYQKKILNAELIRSGYAWVYPQYCKAKFCRSWYRLQKEAKARGLGLWTESSPLPPWKWRSNSK